MADPGAAAFPETSESWLEGHGLRFPCVFGVDMNKARRGLPGG